MSMTTMTPGGLGRAPINKQMRVASSMRLAGQESPGTPHTPDQKGGGSNRKVILGKTLIRGTLWLTQSAVGGDKRFRSIEEPKPWLV